MDDGTNTHIKDILNKTEVSLILDTYDDIFSDFDPRPFNERALSEDFLAEAKRATRDKNDGFELCFMIPRNVRNKAQEDLIRQRLKEHFKRHYKSAKKTLSKYRRNAILLITIGVIIGLIDALTLSTSTTFDLNMLLTETLGIVLTPMSWFSIWTGIEHLVYSPRAEVTDEAFYKKMQNTQISFSEY